MTYGYTGAQMIHQARRMIQEGMLGEIRIINMQFAHGYHSSAVEANDPGTSGASPLKRRDLPTY